MMKFWQSSVEKIKILVSPFGLFVSIGMEKEGLHHWSKYPNLNKLIKIIFKMKRLFKYSHDAQGFFIPLQF